MEQQHFPVEEFSNFTNSYVCIIVHNYILSIWKLFTYQKGMNFAWIVGNAYLKKIIKKWFLRITF